MKNKVIALFVMAVFVILASCKTAPPVKKGECVPLKKGWKVESDADGKWKDGKFLRTTEPAFAFETPANWVMNKLNPIAMEVFNGKDPAGIPVVSVNILNADPKKSIDEQLKMMAEGYAGILRKLGSGVKVISNNPTDMHDEYKAYEYEIEWKFGGTTLLTTKVQTISKDCYFITVSGHTMGDTEPIIPIFESLDFEPE